MKTITFIITMIIAFSASTAHAQNIDTLWTRPIDSTLPKNPKILRLGGTTPTMIIANTSTGQYKTGVLAVLDASNGMLWNILDPLHTAQINNVAMAASTDLCATVDDSSLIKVHDLQSGQVTFERHDDGLPIGTVGVHRIGLSSNGKYLFNCTTGSMHDVGQDSLLWRSSVCLTQVEPIFIMNDTKVLAPIEAGGEQVALYDVLTGQIEHLYKSGPGSGHIQCLVVNPDETELLIATYASLSQVASIVRYEVIGQNLLSDTVYESSNQEGEYSWLVYLGNANTVASYTSYEDGRIGYGGIYDLDSWQRVGVCEYCGYDVDNATGMIYGKQGVPPTIWVSTVDVSVSAKSEMPGEENSTDQMWLNDNVLHLNMGDTCVSATIVMQDASGRTVLFRQLTLRDGEADLTIEGSLASGYYNVALVCDGASLKTSHIIVVK